MKSKIFISGSSGFIGFHTAKKFLDGGFKVYGFDSMNNYYDINLKKSRLKILKKYKNFIFTKGSLENEKKLFNCIFKFKPQIIIHLAAQAGVRYSIKNPNTYLNSNILGTFNILKAASKIKIKHLIITRQEAHASRFNIHICESNPCGYFVVCLSHAPIGYILMP